MARITYNGSLGKERVSVFLGYFDDEEEAKKAYLDAKKIYHTEIYEKI